MHTLFHTVFSNSLISGGLVLMITGAIMALCKQVPHALGTWLLHQVTVSIEISNSDPLFAYITEWLDSHEYSKRSRRITAVLSSSRQVRTTTSAPIMFSPAVGKHWFWYKRHVLFLNRVREKETGNNPFLQDKQRYYIRTLGRAQHIVRDLLSEVVISGSRPVAGFKAYYNRGDCWYGLGLIAPRPIASVILPAQTATLLLEDVRYFLDNETEYRLKGIPWHRGYLLWGVPGSGKTSLVTAIASELSLNIYMLNLSAVRSDDELLHIIASVKPRSIILMEDVDCVAPGRDVDDKGVIKIGVTLSGLLNCLDGVIACEGSIVVMTTNNKAALDSALIRPGRIDKDVEFTNVTTDQIMRLWRRFGDSRPIDTVLRECGGMSAAQVQQYMMAGTKEI